jgi:hypothetical protein
VPSKLAYLTLCRSIQLLVLPARDDTAKDLEILVLRQQVLVTPVRAPKRMPTRSAGCAPSAPSAWTGR